MSFISDLFGGVVDLGKSVLGAVNGGGVGGTLLKTVLTGLALNKVSSSIRKQNSTADVPERASQATTTVDPGVRLQVPANQANKIPVVYGSAQLGGIMTEAVMSNNNQTMTYVLAICEKTGTKLSDGLASSFTFRDIYYNDQRIVFDTTGANAGIEAAYSIDRTGTIDYSIDGLVKVWCYNGNSTSPVAPFGYTNGSLPNAYAVVPNWTSAYSMSNIIFAVVQVNYSKDKGVTGLPTMRFHVQNSMTLPGDCLLDYMTNTRYGAGIPQAEIYVS